MKHKTFYYGGHIITCNLRDDIEEAMITEDNRILFVGGYEEARHLIDADTEIIHIGGRAIMPGITDSMCSLFSGKEQTVDQMVHTVENCWANAVQKGITTLCDDGRGGEHGISALQICQNQNGAPFRALSLFSDNPTHPFGTFATCLSACGIRTGLGNAHYKIGFARMGVTLPKTGEFSLNTSFALFLRHLLLTGIGVQFEPKSLPEVQYALWCARCLHHITESIVPTRMLLPFAVGEGELEAIRLAKCHVVLPSNAIISSFRNNADPINLKHFLAKDIPVSIAFDHTAHEAETPISVVSSIIFDGATGRINGDNSVLSIAEVLRCITLHGAMGALQEQQTGSLEWGKSADYLLLSASPFGASQKEMAKIQILRAVTDGRIVFDTTPLPHPVHAAYVPTKS